MSQPFRGRRVRTALVSALVAVSGFAWPAPAGATVPSGFTQTTVETGLSRPTRMALAPDGRIFVTEQAGAVRIIKNGNLLATPFVTVPTSATGERGLLGIAFDPSFANNGWVYVYYTASTPAPHNRVSRFTANGDVAMAGSELAILDLDNLSTATNHNGGAIAFGPDGKLYVSTGENATQANSQTFANRLGKILRINKDGTIPSDNPFFNGPATGDNRSIWALGLRNPFHFAFQPGTGRMFINDVGAQTWEEINDGEAGANYGWPNTEGPHSNPSFENPLFAYQHDGNVATTGCAITGGAFYNPPVAQFPSGFVGDYFFSDLCSGWVRRYDPVSDTAVAFGTNFTLPVDLRVTPDGALLVLSRGPTTNGGSVVRIQAATSTPTCRGQAATIVGSGTFSGTAGPDVIVGSAGADEIDGLGGDDIICGAGGNDVILPGPGNDIVDGGPGTDRVALRTATGPVTIDLGARTVTGQGNDTLFAFEQAAGSGFADTLRGNAGANLLVGLGGNDVIFGLGGNDHLIGGPGNDTLNGGAGQDRCQQDAGTGTLTSCELL